MKFYCFLCTHTHTELPIWNYDGSSTYQATGTNSDTYLHPVAIYRDPFRRGNHILVLCETYRFDGTPTESNRRQSCMEAVKGCENEKPWFGIEQVYINGGTNVCEIAKVHTKTIPSYNIGIHIVGY